MNIVVAAVLIALHNVDGDVTYVNPDQVTVLVPTKEGQRGKSNELIAHGVHCVVGLSNGKRVSVVEECETIRTMMEEAK